MSEEFKKKYTVLCSSNFDPYTVGIFVTGLITGGLHEELEDYKEDYPEHEPKEFEIEIIVREKKYDN